MSNQNHLVLSDRIAIEVGIYAKHSFSDIAKKISKHPSTVSREIRKNSSFSIGERPRGKKCSFAGYCKFRNLCEEESCNKLCSLCQKNDCQTICTRYNNGVHCDKLDKKPYVCNTCDRRRKCRADRAYYSAKQAQIAYEKERSSCRQGVRLSVDKLSEVNDTLSKLIKKGQPISHIHATHKEEFGISQRTIYNYIDSGVLTVRNIDLRRKSGYKKRKKAKDEVYLDHECRIGRTYDDYQKYMTEHPDIAVVEMDTVKGLREKGKVILTMIFCNCNVMLMFIMLDCKADSVVQIFDRLTNLLGLELFKKLFPLILTDNGSEFKRVHELEYTEDGEQRTKIFYCDPQASWQKPHVEKNHEYMRYVVPKGKPLDGYDQDNINTLMNHVNSVIREKLDNKCPYELANSKEMQKLLELLNLRIIPPDDVHLTPDLLKQ